MTDWLWEKRECSEQKEIYEIYYRDKFRSKLISNEEHDRRYVQKIRRVSVMLSFPESGSLIPHISLKDIWTVTYCHCACVWGN
jgi:hypothetical protein